MNKFKEFLMESPKSDKLLISFRKDMEKIDDSLSLKDFAIVVGTILKEDYGSHNYKNFLIEINKILKIED